MAGSCIRVTAPVGIGHANFWQGLGTADVLIAGQNSLLVRIVTRSSDICLAIAILLGTCRKMLLLTRCCLAISIGALLAIPSCVSAQVPHVQVERDPTSVSDGQVTAAKPKAAPSEKGTRAQLVAKERTATVMGTDDEPRTDSAAKGDKNGNTKTASKTSDLVVVGATGGEAVVQLGSELHIRASGQYVDVLTAAGPEGVVLLMDDVAMPGLKVGFSQSPGANALLVNIRLARDPESSPNRAAWDIVLGKHHEAKMPISLSLAIGKEPAVRVQPAFITFYVASSGRIGTVTVLCLLAFVAAFWWMITNDSILRDAKNGPYSLGKSQMAFWGLVVAMSFLGLWLVTGTMERIPPQVLILMGISAATGLGAQVIGNNNAERIAGRIADLEKQRASLQQTHIVVSGQLPTSARITEIDDEVKRLRNPAPESSKGFWRDICDDGIGMSFHRLQVVMWSLILGLVFIRSVSQVMTMPEFSETLLILMGISSGTYLGFKFPEQPGIPKAPQSS